MIKAIFLIFLFILGCVFSIGYYEGRTYDSEGPKISIDNTHTENIDIIKDRFNDIKDVIIRRSRE